MHTTRHIALIIFGLAAVCATDLAHAEQPYQVSWVRQLGSAGDDLGRGVAVDGTGNIYLSGIASGSLTVPGPATASVPYLAQYDSVGNLHWLRQQQVIPGGNYEGVRVAADGLGNVFTPWRGDDDADEISSDSPSMNNFNAAGTIQWSTELPAGDNGLSVAADGLGFAYLASHVGPAIITRKFDAQTGNIAWTRTLDVGSGAVTQDISVDHLGSVYVSGHTNDEVIGPNAGGSDSFVAKYSDAGNFLWSRQFGSTGNEVVFGMAADKFGNVYTAGNTSGSLGGPNAGGGDLYFAKHNGAGDLQWIKQLGTSASDSISGVWADSAGNVYLAGRSAGDLGGPNLGGNDVFVAKYDSAGNQRWSTQFGTSADDSCTSIAGDAQGNVYLACRTTGSWAGPNAGGIDAVLIKLSPVPEPSTYVLGALALVPLAWWRRCCDSRASA